MKVIGHKSSGFGIAFALMIILLIASITAWIAIGEVGVAFIVPVLLSVGLGIYYGYICFSIPEEIVLYDEENRTIILNSDKKTSIKLQMSDIKHISFESSNTRGGGWTKLIIETYGGEEYSANYIERDNEITDTLFHANRKNEE